MEDDFLLECWVQERVEPIRTTVSPADMTRGVLSVASNAAAAKRFWPTGDLPTEEALANRQVLAKEFVTVLGGNIWRGNSGRGLEVWGGAEAFSIRMDRIEFIKLTDVSEIPRPKKRTTGFSFDGQ